MHEVSLVQGLMEQVRQIAKENNASRITCIKVEIGPFSGVVLDSFSFAFHALKQEDRLLAGSRLEIDSPEPAFKCLNCGKRIEYHGSSRETKALGHVNLFNWGKCPCCRNEGLVPEGGDEIMLMQVEME